MSTINSDKTRPKKSEVYKRAAELLDTDIDDEEIECVSFRSIIFMAFDSFKADYGDYDYDYDLYNGYALYNIYNGYDYDYDIYDCGYLQFTKDEKVIALLFLAAMYDSMGE